MALRRKLTAIMFTDMQGYTAMMQEDEQTAIRLRNRHREIFDSLTKEFRGKIIQYFGDGTLTTFDSTVNAVECALALQKAFLQSPVIPVRIGIHVGDIVFMDHDIIGDAVNIASRIESVAIPGSVFFSGNVNDQLRSHKKFKTRYLNVFHFKNVKDPIPVFALEDNQIKVPEKEEVVGTDKKTSTTPNKVGSSIGKKRMFKVAAIVISALVLGATLILLGKRRNTDSLQANSNHADMATSIAILPVQNLSGQDTNDNWSESITDEFLLQLSNQMELGKVVPKSLISDYLDKGEPIRELANAMEVGYILESALHYSDSLYNLDVRLVDPLQHKYIWSHRYTHISNSNYKTKIQEIIGAEIVLQLNRDIQQEEPTQSHHLVTDNGKAYELLMEADALANKMDKESLYKALPLYEKSVQLDPDMAEGYMGLGRIYAIGGLIWGVFNQNEAAANAKENLQRSLELKPTLEASQHLLITKFFFDQDFKYVDEHLSLVAILPSFPDGAFYTVYCNMVGRFDESIRYAEKYVKRFPDTGNGFAQLIRASFLSGQVQKADSLMHLYDDKFKKDQFYLRDVAMVHLNMGNMAEFKKMNQILKTDFLYNAAVHLYYDAVELTHEGAEPIVIQERLDALKHQYEIGMAGSPAWFLGMYYLYTGDDITAFDWLQKSSERKEVEINWFRTEHHLQPFRKSQDPRYMAIYNQIDWPN